MVSPLFNQSTTVELQKEDAQDRIILLLVAQGFNDRHIARELGVTPQKISYTRKQEWFIKKLVELLHEHGEPAIQKRLDFICQEMIEMGRSLAINATSEAVKATCVFGLIKAARGERVVVEGKTEDISEIKAKREQVEKELAELRSEQPNFPKRDSGEVVLGTSVHIN